MFPRPDTASFTTTSETDVSPLADDIDTTICFSDTPIVLSDMLTADTTASSRPNTPALNETDNSNDTSLYWPQAAVVVVVVEVVLVALLSPPDVVVVVVVEVDTVDVVDVDVVVPNEDAVDVVVDTDGNVSVASEAVNVVV